MTLGAIIKNYRIEHSMSMDEFSLKSGISKSYISLLEKNRHPKTGKPIAPSIQSIKQAADAMSMDFNVLFSMIDGNVSLESPSAFSAADAKKLHLSPVEKQLITSYRRASPAIQQAVLKLLDIQEEDEITLNA